MEKSALVYIVLTAVTLVFGCFVSNSAYTAGYLSGRRLPVPVWAMTGSRRGTWWRRSPSSGCFLGYPPVVSQ